MSNKEILQNYNDRLANNNISLDNVLNLVNDLPEVSGTLDITENGKKDVKSYAEVNVNIEIPKPTLQDKSITITENGTQSIEADEGYDGLNSVEVITNVASSGGEETPITNGAELQQSIIGVGQKFIDDLFDYVNTYETYTNEPITIYAPAETHKYYIIRKKGTTEYGIVWFPKCILNYYNSSNSMGCNLTINSFNLYADENQPLPSNFIRLNAVSGMTMYISSSFTSPEACIEAIQDPDTTYTSSTNNTISSKTEGEYLVPYTNLPCMRTYERALSRKISSNETIVVKS